MKIEIGKYYRSATGVKVGPMDGGTFKWVEGREEGADPEWDNDGTPRNAAAQDIGALIAEWVDEPTTPKIEVGKTYPDRDGDKWECLFIKDDVAFMSCDCPAYRWKLDGTPIDLFEGLYTIDLGPVRGEAVLYGRFVFGIDQVKSDTHKLTIPTEDGQPICGTYTSEAGDVITIEEL